MPTPSAFSAFARRRARRWASPELYRGSAPSSTVFETISPAPWCRSACRIRSLIRSGVSIIRPCIEAPPRTLGASLSQAIAFLERPRLSGEDALAHEGVLFGQLPLEKPRLEHVVSVALREVLPGIPAGVRRHASGLREELRDPLLLHAAAEHQKEHEMADLVMQHMEEHRGTVEPVDENAPLRLNELALRRTARVGGVGAHVRGVFGQIGDLAQTLELKIRKPVDGPHDVVNRDDLLRGETGQPEVELPPGRAFSPEGPVFDEQTHARLS